MNRTTWNEPHVPVPCHDVGRRPRHAYVVLTSTNRVAVMVPPGEVAAFTAVGLHRLRRFVEQAATASRLPRTAGVPADRFVPCLDGQSRLRVAQLICDPGGARLVTPAGGIAMFNRGQIDDFIATLAAITNGPLTRAQRSHLDHHDDLRLPRAVAV